MTLRNPLTVPLKYINRNNLYMCTYRQCICVEQVWAVWCGCYQADINLSCKNNIGDVLTVESMENKLHDIKQLGPKW